MGTYHRDVVEIGTFGGGVIIGDEFGGMATLVEVGDNECCSFHRALFCVESGVELVQPQGPPQ